MRKEDLKELLNKCGEIELDLTLSQEADEIILTIGSENSSGEEYIINDTDDMKNIIEDYIADLYE